MMLKIALVHDWFNEAGGAEKVVKEILHCYPGADVFCLFDFFDKNNRDEYLSGKKTHSSRLHTLRSESRQKNPADPQGRMRNHSYRAVLF